MIRHDRQCIQPDRWKPAGEGQPDIPHNPGHNRIIQRKLPKLGTNGHKIGARLRIIKPWLANRPPMVQRRIIRHKHTFFLPAPYPRRGVPLRSPPSPSAWSSVGAYPCGRPPSPSARPIHRWDKTTLMFPCKTGRSRDRIIIPASIPLAFGGTLGATARVRPYGN